MPLAFPEVSDLLTLDSNGKVVAICPASLPGSFPPARLGWCAGPRLLADRRLGALERLAAVRRFADCRRFAAGRRLALPIVRRFKQHDVSQRYAALPSPAVLQWCGVSAATGFSLPIVISPHVSYASPRGASCVARVLYRGKSTRKGGVCEVRRGRSNACHWHAFALCRLAPNQFKPKQYHARVNVGMVSPAFFNLRPVRSNTRRRNTFTATHVL